VSIGHLRSYGRGHHLCVLVLLLLTSTRGEDVAL
jgi:hypothetical protein